MKPEDFQHHLREINDWWTFMVDWKQGGIFSHVEHYRKKPWKDHKHLLMHVRQLYNYSVGHEHGHAPSEKIARHLRDTLDTVFPEQAGGLYLERLRGDNDRKILNGYTNAYVVIGLSRFARAFGDPDSARRAWEVYRALDRVLSDTPLSDQGVWDWKDPATGELAGKSDNANLHRCEAAVNLYRALSGTAPDLLESHGAGLQRDIRDFMDFFRNRIARPREGWTVESLDESAQPTPQTAYSMQSLAHGLEWMGFFFESEAHCGVPLSFPEEDLRRLARNILSNGLAPSGAFLNGYVPQYRRGPQMASFWPQVEAPLGSLWAAQRWGEELFPREEAERMLAFYRENLFAPPEHGGGIFSTVSENGVPIHPYRGHRFKCDHHAVRMCEKVLELKLV